MSKPRASLYIIGAASWLALMAGMVTAINTPQHPSFCDTYALDRLVATIAGSPRR